MKYLIFLLFLIGCATRPWTTEEKVLLGMSWLGSAAETYTTVRFLDNENNWEINPWLGERPTDVQVILSSLVVNLLITGFVHYVSDCRIIILAPKTVYTIGYAIHNSGLDY